MAQGDLGMRFRQLPLHVLRNPIHYGAQYAWFSALLLIPLADASLVTPMDFLRVPMTALLGFWLYREGLDIYAILGAVLILAANSLNLIKARDPT
jgi:drug/metabolite transporter (DMT)-like permease